MYEVLYTQKKHATVYTPTIELSRARPLQHPERVTRSVWYAGETRQRRSRRQSAMMRGRGGVRAGVDTAISYMPAHLSRGMRR